MVSVMIEYKRSVCPHDCPDTCGLLVGVEEGRVVSIKGDPGHPFTRGSLCVKVNHYPERNHSPLRILQPLRRTGPKGSGRFEPIGWDEALDEIVRRFQAIISKYGAEAILPYSYSGTEGVVQLNAGQAFFHKLGASKLHRTICGPAATAGFVASLGNMPSADIESSVDADLIVIWGSNTLTTNVHAWPFFAEARRKGAAIVVIDPYRTDTAKKADRHLRLKPGTDAALALAMMHVLIREDLLDHEFIAQATIGFDRLAERVKEYPPERASAITGVPAEDITRLAQDYGRAREPYIRTGWGPARQLKGAMAMRAITLLPALTGAFRKGGGGLTRATSAAFGLKDSIVKREDLAPAKVRTVNMVQLGNALNNLADPPIKALFVHYSNPAVVAPDSSKVLKGLRREDLFTVAFEMFPTDTALLADIVLPGASTLEMTDIYSAYGHYYLQMARPVIPPLGESRPALAVFQELARRFGFTDEVFSRSEEDFIREMLPDSPAYRNITFEKLAEGRPLRLDVPANPFAQGFATPSGKVEFFSQTWADLGLDPLPNGAPSLDPDGVGKYPLQLITPPRRYFLNSSFNEVAELSDKAGRPKIMVHPEDASARGVEDDAPVRVFNDRGDVYLWAKVTEDVSPGVTVIEGVYWPRFMLMGRGVNHLTSQRLTDRGDTCAFHCNLVEIEPAD